MKEFKSINMLSREEFEDFMYFVTEINMDKSGLRYKISSIANPYFNKNVPHILVFKSNTNNIDYLNYKTYSDYSIIKLSPNPYLLSNDLNLFGEELNAIFEFVKINKKILMKYWNWKCSSIELKNNIRGINVKSNI